MTTIRKGNRRARRAPRTLIAHTDIDYRPVEMRVLAFSMVSMVEMPADPWGIGAFRTEVARALRLPGHLVDPGPAL